MEPIDGTLYEYLISRGTYSVASRNEGRGYAFIQWKARKAQDVADWERHHSGKPGIRMESSAPVPAAPTVASVSDHEDRDARRCTACGTYGFQGALFTTLSTICNDCA
jgi:hypothetical protein